MNGATLEFPPENLMMFEGRRKGERFTHMISSFRTRLVVITHSEECLIILFVSCVETGSTNYSIRRSWCPPFAACVLPFGPPVDEKDGEGSGVRWAI
jgi:hypothetical protein